MSKTENVRGRVNRPAGQSAKDSLSPARQETLRAASVLSLPASFRVEKTIIKQIVSEQDKKFNSLAPDLLYTSARRGEINPLTLARS